MRDGIILAAGFGTRLHPITRVIPKAVLPIMGKPMILHIMDRMHGFGIERFYINVHYLKDKVMEVVNDSSYHECIEFQVEKELLLTGGGLKGLLKRIETENALVHNVDIIEEFDYGSLWERHLSDDNDITWVLSSVSGNVLIGGRKIVGFGDGGLTFTGVGIYSKRIVNLMPSGKFHLIPWISDMLFKKKIRIGYVIDNNFWVDAGTPYGIFKAYVNGMVKRRENIIVKGYVAPDIQLSGFVYIGEKVNIKGKGLVEDTVIIGKSVLYGNLLVRRSVIYDNHTVAF